MNGTLLRTGFRLGMFAMLVNYICRNEGLTRHRGGR